MVLQHVKAAALLRLQEADKPYPSCSVRARLACNSRAARLLSTSASRTTPPLHYSLSSYQGSDTARTSPDTASCVQVVTEGILAAQEEQAFLQGQAAEHKRQQNDTSAAMKAYEKGAGELPPWVAECGLS